MIFDVLEATLVAAGIGQTGVTIFRNTLPADISRGVFLRSTLAGQGVDKEIPNHFRGRIQAVVRDVDPETGLELAMSVMKALTLKHRRHFTANSQHGRGWIDFFIPETLPIQYPQLDGNGYEWSITFETVFSFEPL